MDKIGPEVLRVSLHLPYQPLVLVGTQQLEVMFCPAYFQSCVVEKHDQSLFAIVGRKVDLVCLDQRLVSPGICRLVFKLHYLT